MPFPLSRLFKGGGRRRYQPYTNERFVAFITEQLAQGMSTADIEDAFQRWFAIKLRFEGSKLTIDERSVLEVSVHYKIILERFDRFRRTGQSYREYSTQQERLIADRRQKQREKMGQSTEAHKSQSK